MNIITVDFETAYGGDLGFAKQTTEEYVRDERFQVIGVAVQVNDGEPEWFSGSHTEIYQFLKKYDWENSLALAHNAVFDGAILNWLWRIKPKGWLDTLSMGRALHGTEVGGSLKVLAEFYGIGEKGKFCTEDTPLTPLSLYGQTKTLAEKMLLDSGHAIAYRFDIVLRGRDATPMEK